MKLVATLLLMSGGLCTYDAAAQQTLRLNASVQANICELTPSLLFGRRIRQAMETGKPGGEVRYPWMDAMRRQGIKRAVVRTRFEWHDRPTAITVIEVLYFSKYDNDCAQIGDPKRLEEIRASGLERELEQVAFERTESARWYFAVDPPVRRAKQGTCSVELVDDERLRVPPPMLAPLAKNPNQLVGAVLRGDEVTVEQLTKGGTSREELSTAMQALPMGGDSCIARVLINAGADVNRRGDDGYTPLIDAVRAQKPAIVKALLEAHADVNATDRWGETALSVAQRNNYTEIVRLLRQADATK